MTFSFAPRARRLAEAYAICALGVVITAYGAMADEARSAGRETIVGEIAPPTREGFEEIVVQMPPLVPMRRKTPAQTRAPVVPEASSTITETIAAVPPAPQAPVDAPAQTETAAQEPVVQTSGPAHAQGETLRGGDASPDLRGAQPPTEEASSDVAPGAALEPPAETAQSEAGPLLEPAQPMPESDSLASESEGDGAFLETWQSVVAVLASAWLCVARLRRKKDEPAARQAASRSAKLEKLLLLVGSARSEIVPFLEAGVRRAVVVWRLLRKRSPADRAEKIVTSGAGASAQAQRSEGVNWPEIATMLRAKGAAEKGASVARAVAERGMWDQPDHDGVELLEPGAAGAQAIVMNARRKLRAAQG
ncbi:MAG: hypothetical protein C3F11_17475 [Methylocystaceae bacterium]|nr:MAG: hypothetical protein C3F11_17475 [Methylocystaceae bacterium]